MKHYIRGVGSGLPIVKEYLDFSHGTITIEDNLGTGAVVTISLRAGEATDMPPVDQSSALHPASAQPSAMEPAYPMHEAPQQLQQQIPPQQPMQQPAYPAQYGYANPPYPQEPRPHDRLTVTSPNRSTRPRAMRRIPTRQARPTIPSTVPRLIALRAWTCKPSMRWRRLSPPLCNASATYLPIFLSEGALGVTDLSRLTGVPQSSTYVALSKLEEAGLIEKTVGQKRILTDLGYHVANSL